MKSAAHGEKCDFEPLGWLDGNVTLCCCSIGCFAFGWRRWLAGPWVAGRMVKTSWGCRIDVCRNAVRAICQRAQSGVSGAWCLPPVVSSCPLREPREPSRNSSCHLRSVVPSHWVCCCPKQLELGVSPALIQERGFQHGRGQSRFGSSPLGI